jgi:YggT family protein
MGFIITFIDFLFTALSMAILARVLLSWVDPQGGNRITQVLHEMTEPILGPIRSIMPSIGMFDFSPIIAILLLNVLRTALMSALG